MRFLINLLVIWIPFPIIRRRLRGLLKYIVYGDVERKNKRAFLPQCKLYKHAPTDFEMPVFDSPVVSVIIPVYNQYKYTHLCLWSILQNTPDVAYEIIIADDCSTDETKDILNHIKNIRVIKTDSNKRFLLNCKNAARHARGKYILFLNNDTQVQPNWLHPLVDLIESDKTIGMVGSQLIYPDLTLQEAGGIIWQDATGANYGRGKKPWCDEYQYVKDVDYISGASIMLPRELWENLGGFDETFVPAYYEDTDLAFQVRQNGLRVVYQPQSRVVHFEGKSNGTDTSTGQKHYQVVNAEKFRTKWADVLKKSHCNRSDVFFARDRSMNKKTLLFIDANILTFDCDCGSRASFQYLQFFKKHGFNVKFLPMSEYPRDYHLDAIRQLGIEVISCNNTGKHKWIKKYGKYIDYVYLNRPRVAQAFIDELRQYTNAKIIYQGHDLHHLRMMREYETNPSKKLLQDIREMEQLEKAILPRMDVVTYFSTVETDKIREMKLDIREMDTVPLYVYDTMPDATYNAATRHDIMFIGGYNHKPNVDAANWLINEIMPRVWAKKPDIKLHLIGSKMPTELQNTAKQYPNIIIDGFVTDEQLCKIYAGVKMSVIPLRFGAGIKGKIIDSIYNKVPVITTSIGAEGINAPGDFLTVVNTAEDIANAIIEMYDNNKKLQKISDASADFIKNNFSENAILAKFKQWIDIK